jgi:predicted transcriptional regulator of viral defense system
VPGPRQDLRRALHELAFRQAGYFSAAQAKELGYSHQAQKYHVDHGNWVRIDRGVFRLPGWPSSTDDVFARWTIWSRGRAVVSHDSALAVHDLSDANPAHIHITLPSSANHRHDALVIHHGPLPDDDVEERGAWRVTTIERTLVDVAGGSTPQELIDAAVAEALARGATTPRRLLRRAADADDHAALRLERALARSNVQ